MRNSNHLHYEFDGQLGDLVEVALDHSANVQLLDPSNYERYRNGQAFRYRGGYAVSVSSPFRVSVPHAGHWHVVVDLGGGTGTVRASVQVIPARQAASA